MTLPVEQSDDQAVATSSRTLLDRYLTTRAFSSTLSETLSPEDCCLQSMENASPVRWHLAHTSWFFETFLLKRNPSYRAFDDHYEVLFNSYYNSVGRQFPRDQRGLISRPNLSDTYAYREHVDAAVAQLLQTGIAHDDREVANIVELGIQHEQQHQELILTDVKHLFSINPLLPAVREGKPLASTDASAELQWIACDEGIYKIGHQGDGFAFDNEGPRHRVFLEPHSLASRPVTSGEFLEFVESGAYSKSEYWLSMGWAQVQAAGWTHPIYWFPTNGSWQEFTLAGLRPLDLTAPVSHVSYFEADAYARWADARLPTEAEWEASAQHVPAHGNFTDTLLQHDHAIHPSNRHDENLPLAQMFGDVWEWTSSSYSPYPGFRAAVGALGEYNGKFMCNQYVLRGGSVATSSSHIRAAYRNFFSPDSRWQFSGFRLAKSL